MPPRHTHRGGPYAQRGYPAIEDAADPVLYRPLGRLGLGFVQLVSPDSERT